MTSAEALRPLVERWLPTQRWYAGKGRDASVQLAALAQLPGTGATIWTARVGYGDGSSEVYQLPLVLHGEPVEGLEHVLLGSIETEDGPRWIYDALHDKSVTAPWLTGIRDQLSTDVLSFTRFADPEAIPVDESSLVLTGEQSNTSLMYGDVAILKVFRRLQRGVNPDLEILEALGRRGALHVPALLGAVTARVEGGTCALAMLQEYLTSATDGWELAKTSVRDLMAEADLHAEEAGGDFAGEAHRLGVAVAEVHAELAAAFGVASADPGELSWRADAMHARLDYATDVVVQLRELTGGLHAAYDALAEAGPELELQRIHGDLHLGQALRTVRRWVIIDFEGEPMGELEVRRRPDSPLRDIAGMLRSFEYAGHHQVIEAGYQPQLAYRAGEWTVRNCEAFLDGYAEAAGHDPRAHPAGLRAFEADKAVYEAVYEARNRPAWLPIPLASLTRLAHPEVAR
ncbi:MAG: maltokinase N-terminal cap-like domain-containing protein [Jatrophihabitantaceae bacterium]